jgi:anti-sigma regulatory factor (Ser/Thr protein kinase)
MAFRAKEKGVALNFAVPSEVLEKTKTFKSDPTRIKQILLNIIGNAIKFTSKGSVDVLVSLEEPIHNGEGNPHSQTLRVTVRDQGVGLTEKQADRLFRPFGQADASTARHFGGSGLGLVISKQIAKSMGGDIRLLSSQIGVGSTFEIKIELEVGDSDQDVEMDQGLLDYSNEDISGKLENKKILAVDDSPENLTLIKMYLKPTDAEISLATGGKEAVELAGTQRFDLILMDVQMPGVDEEKLPKEFGNLVLKIQFSR